MARVVNVADRFDTFAAKMVALLNLIIIEFTRKYPLCRYILGVLTHKTAWDRHCETMKL